MVLRDFVPALMRQNVAESVPVDAAHAWQSLKSLVKEFVRREQRW